MLEIEIARIQEAQLKQDDIQNNQITIMEAIADQHEENLENQIVQMDVLATIYETQLESQEGSV